MLTSLRPSNDQALEHAIALLSQQCWCWGRDILRPSGNWLLETGFERIEPPPERNGCASVYRMEPAEGCQVILRGFGVFFRQTGVGGVFLPRFEFTPRYSRRAELDRLPWTDEDSSELNLPRNRDRIRCASLLLKLLSWIRQYEVDVVERLGLDYRRQTLIEWDNGKRDAISAERYVSEWRQLSFQVAARIDDFLRYDAQTQALA